MAKKSFGDVLAGMSDEELSQLNESQIKDALKKARYSYQRRTQQFKRQHVTSYAEIAFEMARGGMMRDEDGELIKKRIKNKPVDKMSRNQAYHELAQIQHFFQSESATVEGARNINAQQDRRIFGETTFRGKKIPLQRMTNYARERYWAAYEEFQTNEISRRYIGALQSETVQQALGIITVASKGGYPTAQDEEAGFGSRTDFIEKVLSMAIELNGKGKSAVDFYREMVMNGADSDDLMEALRGGGIE